MGSSPERKKYKISTLYNSSFSAALSKMIKGQLITMRVPIRGDGINRKKGIPSCSIVTGRGVEVIVDTGASFPLDFANSSWSSLISSSKEVHSGIIRFAAWSFGSFVNGLLHKSMVLAFSLLLSEHQVSHQSHSCGSDLIGTWNSEIILN